MSWIPSVSEIDEVAGSLRCLFDVKRVLDRLEPDTYVETSIREYGERLSDKNFRPRFDLLTVLYAASMVLAPENYLEIGVRRGRSMAMVASLRPHCGIVGFDSWIPDYAGMPNPGSAFVESELRKVGYKGSPLFVSGNSHDTIPRYLKENEGVLFDIITVDGDHSREGSEQDLRDVLPYVRTGGVIIMDDIVLVPHLRDSWKIVKEDARFESKEHDEEAYGVAFAVKVRE